MNRVSMGSFQQKVAISLISVYLYMEAIYQAWLLYAESGSEGKMPFQSYMKLILHFATRLTGTIITTMAFTNAWRKEYFINQIFYLNQQLQGYGNLEEKKDLCERLLPFLTLFGIFQPLTTAISYIGENKDMRYWHRTLLDLVGLLGILLIPLKVFDPAADMAGASDDFIAHCRRSGVLEKMRRH